MVSWLLLLQPSSADFPCGFVSKTVAMVLAPHHLHLGRLTHQHVGPAWQGTVPGTIEIVALCWALVTWT